MEINDGMKMLRFYCVYILAPSAPGCIYSNINDINKCLFGRVKVREEKLNSKCGMITSRGMAYE